MRLERNGFIRSKRTGHIWRDRFDGPSRTAISGGIDGSSAYCMESAFLHFESMVASFEDALVFPPDETREPEGICPGGVLFRRCTGRQPFFRRRNCL